MALEPDGGAMPPSALRTAALRTAALLAAAVAAAPPSRRMPPASAGPPYYWVFPGRDAPYQDYRQLPNLTVAELEAACTADSPRCLGFNGGGFLKNNLSAFCPAATTLWVKQPVPQPPPPRLLVWPLPRAAALPPDGAAAAVALAPGFALTSSSAPSADLAAALVRALSDVLSHGPPAALAAAAAAAAQLPSLDVHVTDVGARLALGVDETYALAVAADGSAATLTAPTLFGAYHGLQTFAQLVAFDFDSGGYSAQVVNISDSPAYAWRGVMLDVARHFLPLRVLERAVDAVAAAKGNVLHLHLSDWQSVPINGGAPGSAAFALWAGSFSPAERYRPAELAALAEYGRQRGVRVVPELDTPGHADSWCIGSPRVCPDPLFCTGPLAPFDSTFEVIADLLATLAGAFPDDFVHHGGDEVDWSCWDSVPSVAAWRLQHGNMSLQDTLTYFAQRTGNISSAMGGRQTVRWHDLWVRGVPLPRESTVFQLWGDAALARNITADGFRVVFSANAAWYLDHEATTCKCHESSPRSTHHAPPQHPLTPARMNCIPASIATRTLPYLPHRAHHVRRGPAREHQRRGPARTSSWRRGRGLGRAARQQRA